LFRRKSATTQHPVEGITVESTTGGKGRPTPSRKEAEAAARARAKASAAGDRRAAASGDRAARAAHMARTREALKTGDDRYLPARDKGPVKRFVRDFVDTKITFSEWALPLVLVTLAGGFVASQDAARLISNFTTVYILVVAINLVALRLQLGRQLAQRFPGQSTKGLNFYLFSRALQLRWIRQPRPQRSIGEKLPDTYR
jgi:hypothetical protein